MSRIKRIPIERLEVGMYVTDQTAGVAEKSLNQKGLIRKQKTVDKLKEKSITEIYIDVDKGKDSQFSTPISTNPVAYEPSVPLEEERKKAASVHNEALDLVDNLMQDIKVGKAVDVAEVEELADDINNSVLNNQNALLCLSQIREKDRYLLEHSVNVGLLIGIFSRHLGYDAKTVHQLITGALLHDIGKILVPDEILHKPGKLTDKEWIEMKRHVVYGQQVLLKSEGITDIAMAICGQHHERLDGSGYPLGLADKDLSTYGRIAAIVDVYDAITASRVYHDGMLPSVALKRMLEWSGDHLDKTLVYHFIRCMSVYPIGTVVELNNQKAGVVSETHTTRPDSPRVRVCFDIRSGRVEETATVVNLAHPESELKIVKTRDPDELGIAIGDYL